MRSPSSLSQHRTFRWNDGVDVDRYAAVETRDDGLRWYTWSHAMGEGGARGEIVQAYDEFLRDGPPPPSPGVPPAPPSVIAALHAWIDERR